MFENLKLAKDLIKNINPSDLSKLMEQATKSQKVIEEIVRKIVHEELQKLNLPTRQEIDEIKTKINKIQS